MRTATGMVIRPRREGGTVHKPTRSRLGAYGASDVGWMRRWATVVVTGALVCLVVTVSAAPALASWGIHRSFGAGELETPIGVAVDEAGSVYVGSERTYNDKFNVANELVAPSPFGGKSGSFFSGVAVNAAGHDVYSVGMSPPTIFVFNPETGQQEHEFEIPDADYPGGFAEITIAADAHGNVYIPDVSVNKVEIRNDEGGKPTGGVVEEINGLSEPEGVAIGPTGNVWVADTGVGKIEEFEPNGMLLKEIVSKGVQAVALDGSGDVFASIGGSGFEPNVIEFSSSGTKLAEFGKGLLSESSFGSPNGIAVDRTREIVYVADGGGNVIQRFTDWAVTTDAPSNLESGQAKLNGAIEVEPGVSVASCEFQYGSTTAYGSSVPCSPGGPYTTDTSVSAKLSGLSGDTHYRISIPNAGGEYTKVGTDQVFGPPEVDSESAEAVVTTTTLRARLTVLAAGASTCEAQYVAEAEYETSGYAHAQSVQCTTPIGNAPGEYNVETAEIEGLQANTSYHYRFLTTNEKFGTATGPGGEFATFGVAANSFAFEALGQANEQVTQAGTHPYELTDKFTLNTSTHRFTNGTTDPLAPDANAKDVITELPRGLIGNPEAVPKCEAYNVLRNDCSGAAQVGIVKVDTANPSEVAANGRPAGPHTAPIYNLVPPKGVAAQFGANVANLAEVHIDARVRTGGDYGVTAEVLNISTEEGLVAAEVTLWGVPAMEGHDGERYCPPVPPATAQLNPCSERGPLIPFLTNPTACAGEREARMTVEPWQEDNPPVVVPASAKMPPITGCGKLDFKPSMTIQPTSSASDSSTGLHVELKVPQNESPTGLAEADLKDAKVTLPEGVTVNPSSANGMAGCPLLTGKEGHPGVSGIDLENGEPANCPDASKVGKVTIKTPLLEEELTGGVYVAEQNANPFKSLLALYIAVEDAERGVVVKLAGHVELDPITGQLTTTFDENPQLPFEDLKLDFFGGERAPLATPRTCGSYQASSVLEPFSHQGAPGEEGAPDAEPFIAPFSITSGPGGSVCEAPPFSPSFTAGTTNDAAGAFTPFVMNVTRKDGEQTLSTIALEMPPGISGMVSAVTLCPEAQANAGDCPAVSRIGHVRVSAGVGNEPIVLPEAGRGEDPVYLTGPYKGAPFGLSVIVPAEAGPFNLDENGHPIVVRAKVEVDPHTAQVTVVSDPMPTRLQGIPLDVRDVEVVVDKPGFIFNPTNCDAMSVAGAIGSNEGASENVSSRYQAADCANLPFKPSFSTSTQATHTRNDGAYLHVVVRSGPGEANIGSIKVDVPKKLPSRLSTLKLACTEAQFAANPAGCPTGSKVGTATATTPVLPVVLSGPAYFVSHGGAKFPELVIVLQGDNVTLELAGETFINSAGITSSTFHSVPDVPVTRFDLVLPTGPDSVLAGNGNFCTGTLHMPTEIKGQNGAVIKQETKVAVTGCKPTVTVVRHGVKGAKATVVASVPSAGKLIVTGDGLVGGTKTLKKAGEATLDLSLSKQEQLFLARHPGRKLKVRVHLLFEPTHGSHLSTSVTLLMR